MGASFWIRRDTLDIGSLRGDHALQRLGGAGLREPRVLGLELIDQMRPIDDQRQHLGIDGLLAEVIGAETNGAQGMLAPLAARHDDDLGTRRRVQDLADGGETFLDAVRIRRQAEVLQHDRRLEAPQGVQRISARRGAIDLELIQGPFELALQPGIVLDHQ